MTKFTTASGEVLTDEDIQALADEAVGAETKRRYRFHERVLWLRASAQTLLASVSWRRLPAQVVAAISAAMPIPTAKQSPATSR